MARGLNDTCTFWPINMVKLFDYLLTWTFNQIGLKINNLGQNGQWYLVKWNIYSSWKETHDTFSQNGQWNFSQDGQCYYYIHTYLPTYPPTNLLQHTYLPICPPTHPLTYLLQPTNVLPSYYHPLQPTYTITHLGFCD